jgi:hypothetical protein
LAKLLIEPTPTNVELLPDLVLRGSMGFTIKGRLDIFILNNWKLLNKVGYLVSNLTFEHFLTFRYNTTVNGETSDGQNRRTLELNRRK